MPYFRETSISFFWVCRYNKLNKFNEGDLVFADVLPFAYELHRDPFLHPSNNDSSYTVADSNNVCIDPQQPPVGTHICVTPHCDNRLAGKHISNKYFDIFDNELDL